MGRKIILSVSHVNMQTNTQGYFSLKTAMPSSNQNDALHTHSGAQLYNFVNLNA